MLTGRGSPQQPVNQLCRELERSGVLIRRKREDGLIGNYLRTPDLAASVYRVEVRVGKKELKDRWGIRTFADVDCIIGDVIRHALNDVRYLAERQGDSNVTRQRLDPP